MDINKLLEKKEIILSDMRGILDLADSEEREITEDEETRYNELEATLESIEADIEKAQQAEKRRKELEKKEAQQKEIRKQPPHMAATYRAEDPKEFKSFGEFVYSVRFNQDDPRLYDLWNDEAGKEARAQSMGVGSEGGFAVPTQFRPQLLSVAPDEAIFRPRATVIPAGTPPDSAISMPALAQGAADNMYGGFTVQWIGEGDTKPETDIKLREVELTPHEVAAHTVITDKLLRNWAAADAVISTQARLAVIGSEETAFYNGNGVARPLGILQSPARIDYARATANQIAYADVTGMYARLRMVGGGSPVWIASQTTIPQLTAIVDAGSNNLWVQNAAVNMPPSLMGFPVLFHERSVALGTKGDLILCSLGYYMIKDGSGPFVQTSPHFYFTSNKTVLKIFWNVDGAPWLNEPIPLEGSTSNTVSPFIVLN